ncbi:hypothetical protein JRG18_04075 [Kocuria palustris]|jgi:alpha-beta hydrolase superfamily lysophospholipase|uniref:hypothetical protein n=1 Tax=Kocuria palustris TaxID=71999 RepID=UPI0019CFF41F|nr:hypothetical protein [Kocuria palustris]MBN6752701.1 hypothetical protein [Kocuria palustris]MBN6757656.1 hypothetical protein [Kocuria palustris]MBN6762684.1 hypothetical protein [Kocuria palustris]MBN6782166.1 hypothetical protein [Kocuria palustris]MBN6798725.1 hypothetical protein [Kocuria palustris]
MSEEDQSELGVPVWVPAGDQGHALAARVHRPRRGRIRRILVLAPPFGREQVISSRTLRVLAVRAARDHGALVLRSSWSGTGESTEPLRQDPARAWARDLIQLIRTGRELAPGAAVTVIGLRLGAAVAASVLEHPEAPEAAVLWEPIDGRRFVREQRALRRLSIEQPSDPGGVEIPGVLLTSQQAGSLKSLKLPEDGQQRAGVQMLSASDRTAVEKVYAVASRDAEVPVEIVEEVIRRATDAAPAAERMTTWQPTADSAGRLLADLPRRWLSPGPEGTRIVQEFVEIGPHGLPGVLTAADSPADLSRMPGMLLVAADAEPMDGPTGLWARAARDLAARGSVVLRSDRRGIGEGADPQQLREPMPYTEEAVEDVREALGFLRGRIDRPVVSAGLCSGAWFALRCARDGADRVVLLNTIAWTPRGAYYWRYYRDGLLQQALGGREALLAAPESWKGRLKHRLKAARDLARQGMPGPLRRGLSRLGLMQSVGQMFRDPATTPPVTVYVGADDEASFAAAGGRREVQRLRRRGFDIRVEPLGDADHALLAASSRRLALVALHDAVGSEPIDRGASAA